MYVKGGKSEWFRIDSGVRQGCIMSPLAVQCIYMDGVMKELKMGIGRRGVEIAWPLVCKSLGSIWCVGGRPEGNGGMV